MPSEKDIPQNLLNASPGGVTREVAVEDTTNAVVRYGDAANKAVRVNMVAGGGGGGVVTQGPSGNPNDPWNMEVTEDGTNTPVKPGDVANKAVRVNIVDAVPITVVTDDPIVVNVHNLFGLSSDNFVAPGDGALRAVNAGGGFRSFSITVKGLDGGGNSLPATTWAVVMQITTGNGPVTYTPVFTHSQIDGDGILTGMATIVPFSGWRVVCTSLVLGPAASIQVEVITR